MMRCQRPPWLATGITLIDELSEAMLETRQYIGISIDDFKFTASRNSSVTNKMKIVVMKEVIISCEKQYGGNSNHHAICRLLSSNVNDNGANQGNQTER
jgi:hypothetical protein